MLFFSFLVRMSSTSLVDTNLEAEGGNNNNDDNNKRCPTKEKVKLALFFGFLAALALGLVLWFGLSGTDDTDTPYCTGLDPGRVQGRRCMRSLFILFDVATAVSMQLYSASARTAIGFARTARKRGSTGFLQISH